jgi:hypothetical protein
MKQGKVVRNSKWFRNALLHVGMSNTRFEGMLVALLVCLAASTLMLAADNVDSTAVGTRTVEGLVRDIACPLQNRKSTATNYSKDCITMCEKAGSPLGILTSDGSVYLPVTESMPDSGQNALKPFVGEHVQATGKVFERNGGHAIEISDIHQLPDNAGSK